MLLAGEILLRLLSREGTGRQSISFQCRQRAPLAADFAVHGLSGIGSGSILAGYMNAGFWFSSCLGFFHDWDAIGAGRLRNPPTRANRVITPRTTHTGAC